MRTQISTLSILLFVAACGGGGSNNNTNVDAPTSGQHDAPQATHDSPTTNPDGNNTNPDGNNTNPDGGVTPDGNNTNPDGGVTPDGSVSATCTTSAALGAQDAVSMDTTDGIYRWGAPITTNLGDGGPAVMGFEFYDDGMTDLSAAPIDLSMGAQNNYSTCLACVLAVSYDATNMPKRYYFQSGGTMTLTADPVLTETMVGTIANLTLTEVTIDSSAVSTNVVGGKCLSIGTVTLNHDDVPNAWTCTKPQYADGASCDCACGAPDPDCGQGLPTAGCSTAGMPVCSMAGTCEACTVNATLGTPTITSQQASFDGTVTRYDGLLNTDANPDVLDIQLWDGYGVFTAGVVPGTYQLTGAELNLVTCGACVSLLGDVDLNTGAITQDYFAKSGTLTLTSTAGTLTGTLTNATFGGAGSDADGNTISDGTNCASSLTSASFTSTVTDESMLHKTTTLHTQPVHVTVHHGKKPQRKH